MKHKNSHYNQIEIGPEDISRSSSRYFVSNHHHHNQLQLHHHGYHSTTTAASIDNYMMDDDNNEEILLRSMIKDNNNNNNNGFTHNTTTSTNRSRSSSLSSSPNINNIKLNSSGNQNNNNNNNNNNNIVVPEYTNQHSNINNNNNNNPPVQFNNFNEKLLFIKKLLATSKFNPTSTTTTTTTNNKSNSSPTTLSSPISNLMSACNSSSVVMSPLTVDSISRPISPVQIISPSMESQQQQHEDRDNLDSEADEDDDMLEYPSSVSTIQSYIRQLNVWISQIDRCSPSARAIVWENYRMTCFTKAYPGVDPSGLSICDTPFWSDKRTSKFRAHYNSIIRQPNPDYHSIKMLYVSFTDAIKNNSNLFEQCSPQTKTEEEEDSFDQENSDVTLSNPFLLNANLFLSGSVWDCSFPAALQQLLYLLYWAPHLDKLPSNLRKMIWENCCTYPPFKELTSSIKLNNFTKVIKGWSNNPMHYMLAITTLFGSIGFLVEQKALKNEFTYPNSTHLVFSEIDNNQSYSPQQPSTPIQPDQQIDVPELSNKKKKLKKSKSIDQAERVPSMSPISIKQTSSSNNNNNNSYLSPSSSFSASDDLASDSEMNLSIDSSSNSNKSSKDDNNHNNKISSIDSISSMIDKAIKSSVTNNINNTANKKPISSSTINTLPNNINFTPKKQSNSRSRSASLNYTNSYNIFNSKNNNNSNNTVNSNVANSSKPIRSTLHLSSDSVPVTAGYITPTTVSEMNAVSAVPVDIANDGSSLDVLAMTAFQFEGLDEASKENNNISSNNNNNTSISSSNENNRFDNNCSNEEEMVPKTKENNKSFLSRKRRYSTELEEKQDATMNINNILCS